MAQAPLDHSFPFDLLSFFLNSLGATVVNIGGCQVAEALVVPLAIVIFDEGFDLALETPWQEVVLKQDTVLHGLMPSLYLALRLWVVWCATDVIHTLFVEVFSQIGSDVG